MKIIYNLGEVEYARGVDFDTGVHWVIYRDEENVTKPYNVPNNFFEYLKKAKEERQSMEANKLSPELVQHFRKKILGEDVEITATILETEIEDTLWRMLSNFEDDLQKKFEGKFEIDIDFSDITVDVSEIDKPKDKASKEIEEVLKELNRIYKGQYKFDYTSEEK
jgi:phosphoenolpyruvate carboxylase